jgi:hypothetical protein
MLMVSGAQKPSTRQQFNPADELAAMLCDISNAVESLSMLLAALGFLCTP